MAGRADASYPTAATSGYPYQFLTAPFRALPLMGGEAGEPGIQGVCYDEGGLPGRYRGNIFVCDWGRQAVVCFEIRKAGGTFAVARQATVVSKGIVADFHPLALAVTAERNRLLGCGLGERCLALRGTRNRQALPVDLLRSAIASARPRGPTASPSATRSRRSTTRLFPSGSNAQRFLAGQGEQAVDL